MKVASKPALNKDGFCKFTVVEFKADQPGTRVNPDTGEIDTEDYLLVKIMDTTRKAPLVQKLYIPKLNSARADVLLANLGYVSQTRVDEEGFETEVGEIGDDGFETEAEGTDLVAEVTAFLNTLADKSYLAKIERNKKGFWTIDIESIKAH